MVVVDLRFMYLIGDSVLIFHIELPVYFQARCSPNVLIVMAKFTNPMDIRTVLTWSTLEGPPKFSRSMFIQCCINSKRVLIQNGVRMCG